jgi:hypothetical protein
VGIGVACGFGGIARWVFRCAPELEFVVVLRNLGLCFLERAQVSAIAGWRDVAARLCLCWT